MSRLNRKYIFSKLGLKRSAGPSTTVAEIKQCNPTCSYGARVTKQFNPLLRIRITFQTKSQAIKKLTQNNYRKEYIEEDNLNLPKLF